MRSYSPYTQKTNYNENKRHELEKNCRHEYSRYTRFVGKPEHKKIVEMGTKWKHSSREESYTMYNHSA